MGVNSNLNKPYTYVALPKDIDKEASNLLSSLHRDGIRFVLSKHCNKSEDNLIEGSFGVLIFLTKSYVENKDLHHIVNTAVAFNKKILTIFWEDVPTSAWNSLQLGSTQAIYAYQYDNQHSFFSKVHDAMIFQNMSITKEQIRFQKRRSLSIVCIPILCALILFFTVINPLLIAPVARAKDIASQWGLTLDEMKSMKTLYIIGNQAFSEEVHGWYDDQHQEVFYDVSNGSGGMYYAGSVTPGELEDLSFLQYMPNLEKLVICGNQITDITPVLQLKKLILLDLSANPISSLDGIDVLENLQVLRLSSTQVSDLTPLLSCEKLHILLLDRSWLKSISGIEQIQSLQRLNVTMTYVTSLEGVEQLSQLESLECMGTNISQLPDLSNTSIEELDIRETPIIDLTPLSSLSHLESLDLTDISSSTIVDCLSGTVINAFSCSGLSGDSPLVLSGLKIQSGGRLGIANSKFVTLEGIEQFEGISILDIHGYTNLTDLSPILNLHSLRYLYVSTSMKSMVETQLQDAPFTIEYDDSY